MKILTFNSIFHNYQLFYGKLNTLLLFNWQSFLPSHQAL